MRDGWRRRETLGGACLELMSVKSSVSSVVLQRSVLDPAESPTAMLFLGWGNAAAASAPTVCVVHRVEVMRPNAGNHCHGVGQCIDQNAATGPFCFSL